MSPLSESVQNRDSSLEKIEGRVRDSIAARRMASVAITFARERSVLTVAPASDAGCERRLAELCFYILAEPIQALHQFAFGHAGEVPAHHAGDLRLREPHPCGRGLLGEP